MSNQRIHTHRLSRGLLPFGKGICVTGMIQSYQGRPEIIVKDPSQIKVK